MKARDKGWKETSWPLSSNKVEAEVIEEQINEEQPPIEDEEADFGADAKQAGDAIADGDSDGEEVSTDVPASGDSDTVPEDGNAETDDT